MDTAPSDTEWVIENESSEAEETDVEIDLIDQSGDEFAWNDE